MTDEQFLIDLLETAIPELKSKVTTGNGKDLKEFLASVGASRPNAFVSWEGFIGGDQNESGSDSDDAMNYIIYLRSDDSVKPVVMNLKTELYLRNSEFVNDEDQPRYVQMTSGQAYRDDGSDAFGINVTIK